MRKDLLEVLKSNLIKTIRFNFKLLPFKQAIRLPILFYGKVDLRSLKGRVRIDHAIGTGMIKIGIPSKYVDTQVPNCRWTVNGLIVFHGPLEMARGSYVLVAEGAVLSLGTEKSFYGSNLKIFCFSKITIGNCVRISWECQIYDTSFHYLEKIDDNNDVKPLSKEVFIGDRVWLGNRSTVAKGAIIPNDTIVASNSLVNKSFENIAPYGLLAGIPASLKSTGLKRIFDRSREREFDKRFSYHRTWL